MHRRRLLVLFTFLGAALLFGVEPLVGRLLLPVCGGGFHVWTTALMVFQGALFLGYLYCHLLAPRLGRGHVVVAAAALLFLPLAVQPGGVEGLAVRALGALGLGLAAPDPDAPIGSIVRAMAVGVVVPFALLATTGVLAQAWLARSDLPGRDEPYPLYAASNLGSLAALLAYPLLAEPLLPLGAQRVLWSLGVVAWFVLAWRLCPPGPAPAGDEAPTPGPLDRGAAPDVAPAAGSAPADAAPAGAPAVVAAPAGAAPPGAAPAGGRGVALPDRAAVGPGRVLAWALLAAAPSAFLLAVTNVIALDVGSAPFVWVLPLALYLLSFVLAFQDPPREPGVLRRFWPEVSLVGLLYLATGESMSAFVGAVHLGVLFVACLVAHAALFRLRPPPARLTGFYLTVAAGGWAGGVLVSVVAPYATTRLVEYPAALAALALTLLVARRRALGPWVRREPWWTLLGSGVVVALVALRLAQHHAAPDATRTLHVHRNPYGVYRIDERALTTAGGPVVVRRVVHGTTLHGKEAAAAHPGVPIGYYHARSPLGEALATLPPPRRAALVGLGAGATVAHFGAGEDVAVYELDPDVVALARAWFGYLPRARATVRVVPGDARLALARDPRCPDGELHVLVVDAFSSDAIPVHLLTTEALALWASKLAPGGLLLLHVSSNYYDLRPVVAAGAARVGLAGAWRTRAQELAPLEDPSDWIALAREPAALAPLRAQGWSPLDAAHLGATAAAWTDDYANVLAPLWIRWQERRRAAQAEAEDAGRGR